MRKLPWVLLILVSTYVPTVAIAEDGSKVAPNPHVDTNAGPGGIETSIDGHGKADGPDSNRGAPRATDPNAFPVLPCFGASPTGPGPACPTTPRVPDSSSASGR